MSDSKPETRGYIAWMARNPVTANLVMLMLLIGGVITAGRIKKQVFPDFDMDRVSIVVAYPGASPEEVERGIVLAVEENVRGLEGVKEVRSTASEGRASIDVELFEDVDSQKVYQEIRQEVDRITTLPEDAEEPVVRLATHRHGVLDIALYGDVPERILREQAEIARDRFLASEQITQVELSGIRGLEISLFISRDTLKKYNLTLGGVAAKINALALELPGGGIKTEAGEILLRMKERRDYGEQFASLPIVTENDGTVVLLRDVAEIDDGFDEDAERFASWNGKPAVMIDIYRIGDQTPISVSEAGQEVIEELNHELPPGLELAVRRDRSDIYRQRINLLKKNGIIGITLVMIVLGLFLEARLAFWVMMGIPISFLGGMILLPYTGTSINLISMFAFLISLGIVVDDAIVVGENVYEHRQRGDSFLYAAIKGTKEVCVPVTFSVLTNMVTFLPLMFLPGFIGKIWFFIPVVVNLVFFFSLMECLFILPAHLGHAKPGTSRFAPLRWLHGVQQPFSRFFMRKVRTVYGPVLETCLRNRYIVVAIGIAVLVTTVGYVRSQRIGVVPMMAAESDWSAVIAVLPYGSPVEKTFIVRDRLVKAAERVADRVDDANEGVEFMRGVYADVGGGMRGRISGSHTVQVRAYLCSSKERARLKYSTVDFTRDWRKEAGDMVGLEAIRFQADQGGPGSGPSLSIKLLHSDSGTLDKAGEALAEALAEFPIVSDIDDGASPGKQQLNYRMRPEGLALGITSRDVARQVRNAFYGAEAMRQQRGRNEVKIKTRLPRNERLSEHDLDELLIRTPAGVNVPLRDVARVERGRAYTRISREDGKRTVVVTANVTPRSQSENILSDVLGNVIPELRSRFPGLDQGFSGRQEDLREGMSALLFGFCGAIVAVYALLAVPFRSYTQPLIIMTCIPFGIVGAVLAHVVMGYPLSLMSMMGIVALSGVVVNDSLILIDFANGERKHGASSHDAVCTAGIRRFRPILLTTLTTFFGLSPMIFETSRQAKFMIPMAISLGFGILFSTVITLLLVPCLYLIIDDFQGLGNLLLGRRPETGRPRPGK